jgi:peptide/nickel transport system substrate-binding protein
MKVNKLLRMVVVIVVGLVAVDCVAAPTPRVQQVIVVPAATDTVAVTVTAQALVSPPAPTTAQAVVVVTRTPLASSAPTAKSSDTLVVGMRSEPDTLYPLLSSMFAQSIVNSALFAVCTRENEKLEWIPEMCASVPTLENGSAKWIGEGADRYLEVTFKLKSGWKWHDGTCVTANDYVFTWELALDPELEVVDRKPWEKIQEVTAPDDQTVVVKYHSEKTLAAEAAGRGRFPALKADYARLKEATPTGPLVSMFYYALGSPLPAHLLSEIPARDQPKSDFARRPIGNGAYKFKDWKPSGWIELEANADFQLGAPKIKNIVFRFVPDVQATLAAMQQGELDVVTQDGPLSVDVGSELDTLEKAGYRLYLVPNFMWEHIDLNTTHFPLDDVRVRRALAYATNVQEVVNQTRSGKVIEAYSFLPPVHWAYDDMAVVKYDYNLSKARVLLKEADWSCSQSPCTRKTVDGKTQTLEFTLATTDRLYRQEIAQILQKQWSEVGFRINLQILPGRNLFQPASQNGPLASRTFDAALYAWGLGEDPDLVGLYDCASIPSQENDFAGQNYPGWCNRTANDKIVAASSNPDFLTNRAKLKSALADVQRAWTADVPVIPLIHNVYVSAARVGLKGYTPTPAINSPEFWNAWQWEWSK